MLDIFHGDAARPLYNSSKDHTFCNDDTHTHTQYIFTEKIITILFSSSNISIFRSLILG